ncbi:hypothetical protein [Streptomyces sp. enrichment culture]|uniref:hypothetical protein n=1 Tax=Streptomyces sp. enrichment culture TaxID=1795815 RepID=UPI003F5751B6
MTTTSTPTTGGPATGTATDVRTEPRYAWWRRGRHRRPRPRKVLLVAGGLALAAAALSVVRLLPEPGGDGGVGHGAEAAPRVDGAGRDTAPDDRATAATATGADGGTPGASPSATSAMDGLSGSPEPGLIPDLVPGPTASGPPAPLPASTAEPGAQGAPDASEGGRPGEGREQEQEGEGERDRAPGSPQPSHSDRPAPHSTPPAPPPGHSTPSAPAPAPEPDDPGLCVPVIGLCVDLLGD